MWGSGHFCCIERDAVKARSCDIHQAKNPPIPWIFLFGAPLAVSFRIPSAPHALLVATVVSLANLRASPALQAHAILLSQALRALRVFPLATVLLVNHIAANVPLAASAVIQPVVRRFALQAITALPILLILPDVNQVPCA